MFVLSSKCARWWKGVRRRVAGKTNKEALYVGFCGEVREADRVGRVALDRVSEKLLDERTGSHRGLLSLP